MDSELRSYNPTWRDKLSLLMLGDDPSFYRQKFVEGLTGSGGLGQKNLGAVDITPVGGLFGIQESALAGDSKGAALAAVGLLPGANAMTKARSVNIRSLGEIKRIIDAAPENELFVRWSRGPKFDMATGARSRDYVSGAVHDGLSATVLSKDDGASRTAKMLRDYSFLRAKDKNIQPHIYEGKHVGIDSDGSPTIKPVKYVGTLSKGLIDKLDDDKYVEALQMLESINRSRGALDYAASNPDFKPSPFFPYSEEKHRALEEGFKDYSGILGPDIHDPVIKNW